MHHVSKKVLETTSKFDFVRFQHEEGAGNSHLATRPRKARRKTAGRKVASKAKTTSKAVETEIELDSSTLGIENAMRPLHGADSTGSALPIEGIAITSNELLSMAIPTLAAEESDYDD